LLAHGSPDPRWRRTFESGLAVMRPGLQNATSLAYLEMSTPTLGDVIRQQHDLGTRKFAIVPLFFAAGRHLLTDVPMLIESLCASFTDIDIELHEPVGEDPAFWDFLATKLGNMYARITP
jgi:sirohydrochlorin cobaltochelatase